MLFMFHVIQRYITRAISGLWLLLCLAGSGCTENPVRGSSISARQSTISGQVELLDSRSPEGTVVWLEGFDILTETDASGRFEFAIPPKISPNAQGSRVSGSFRIFFYMANYKLRTITAPVRDGEFVYGEGPLDSQGNIVEQIILTQLLDVKTTIEPETITIDDEDRNASESVIARIFLNTTYSDTVFVVAPSKVSGFNTPLLFRNVTDSLETQVLETVVVGPADAEDSDTLKVTNDHAFELVRDITAALAELEKGEYEVVPFLHVLQEDVPQPLLQKLGVDARISQIGKSYLNIPFLRTKGFFEIQPAVTIP